MLSILIPVYNYDVRGLVSDLLTQVNTINEAVEICLLNDGSDSQWLDILEKIDESDVVSLHHSSTNQGRVASRMNLAKFAKYDYLLFIDCDAKVILDDFVSNYLDIINSDKVFQVIAGGHVYQKEIPEEEYRLHWQYGREIEVQSPSQRNAKPYDSFSTFNFCIDKRVFINYLSGLNVSTYGHEDTLMGNIMKAYSVGVVHIDNPLLHSGLKDKEQFLLDVAEAVKNAYRIAKENPDVNIKLIKYSDLIDKLRLSKMILFVLSLFENVILKSLKSAKPNLKCLQLYKLKKILELKLNNS